jgi:putative sterol carrier protein
MTMQPEIQKMIDKFHRRMEKDEDARKQVEPVTKTLNIDLGEEKYSMKLEHAKITDFKAEPLEAADITLITTPENLQGLIDGTLRPMKAYVTKKIVLKGKIEDIMYLRKLF